MTNKSRLNQVVYDVLLENDSRGDLIEFYNKVYISKLKSFFNELPNMNFYELNQYKFGSKRRHFGDK